MIRGALVFSLLLLIASISSLDKAVTTRDRIKSEYEAAKQRVLFRIAGEGGEDHFSVVDDNLYSHGVRLENVALVQDLSSASAAISFGQERLLVRFAEGHDLNTHPEKKPVDIKRLKPFVGEIRGRSSICGCENMKPGIMVMQAYAQIIVFGFVTLALLCWALCHPKTEVESSNKC